MSQNNDLEVTVKYILETVKDIHSDHKEMNKILAINTQSLQEHMRRTEQNEESIQQLQTKIEPVIKHVDAVNLIVKVCLGIGSLGLTIVGILAAMRQAGMF